MVKSRVLTFGSLIAAVLLSLYLMLDATWRAADKPSAINRPTGESQNPVAAKVAPPGEPRREATCRTTPAAGQASMSHEDCAFIASQIEILPSNTDPNTRTAATVPSPALAPGADIPSDVRALEPLPDTVIHRLPALRDHKYFRAGHDIVVVGDGAKIAFVVDVQVRR